MSSTPQWYMAVGGQQVGPVTEEEIVNNIKSGSVDHETLVFISGMDAWTPLRQVAKFQGHLPALAPVAPPPMPASARSADIIDYKIEGEDLPSACAPPIRVRREEDRPQPKLDRDCGGGMTVVVGRVRPCPVLDFKIELLSHNTVRGAAGGTLLNAELLVARGRIARRSPD